jgi:hypothetical protein
MKKILLALALLLLASVAEAQTVTGWYKSQSCAAAGKIANADLSLNVAAYYCINSTAGLNSFSPVLLTSGWVLDVVRAGDILQGAAGACQVELYAPFKGAGATVTTTTGIAPIRGDVDGDGVEESSYPLDGTQNQVALRGFLSPSLVFKVTTLPLAGEQCVIAVLGRR